ncbi:hypothetical protein CPB83DRAFT_96744 [Crepidotus variabilis]|uniref:Uncharacterized protein n=1 Tax=Crepidotus variabilis TaxID=179855 RepID=A0A9P6E4T5_9AGAR|nr:hypothetical protein CPB83DRAFT_96744 [Crepidotus variabilis]
MNFIPPPLSSMSSVFAIEYPVTRTIQWRGLSLISYGGAFIVVIFLTLLNVALVGYETASVFQTDFNFTQHFWYTSLVPYKNSRQKGLCEPHLFSIGDQVRTVRNNFEWTVVSIERVSDHTSRAGFPYRGKALDNCDITRLGLNSTAPPGKLPVLLECFNIEGYHVTFTMIFQLVLYVEGQAEDLILPRKPPQDFSSVTIDPYLSAYDDFFFGEETRTTAVLDNHCPASSGTAECAQKLPSFKATVSNWVRPPRPLDSKTHAPLHNFIQTMYAWLRVELGIDSSNNFLLHREALPNVIIQGRNLTLYSVLEERWLWGQLPYNVSSLPIIEAEYLCKYQQLKSPGTLIISVLVAVLSMFSSGWAFYLFIISSLAKRSRGANSCEGHKNMLDQSVETLGYEPDTTTISGSQEREEWPLADLERGR